MNAIPMWGIRETMAVMALVALCCGAGTATGAPTFDTTGDYAIVGEGGTATFRIRLSEAPSADVIGTVSFVAGDADLTINSGADFTIPKAAWNSWVEVVFAAAEDADSITDSALFAIRESTELGIPDRNISVVGFENEVTTVGGTLATDTTWDQTGQEYLITSPVTIPEGVTLTIAPGVIVRQAFDQRNEILVDGTLNANNASFFLHTHGWYNDGRWHGIRVRSGGTATLTGCTLRTVELHGYSTDGNIDYWGAAVQAVAGANLTVQGCSIQALRAVENYRSGYGLRIESATATVQPSVTLAGEGSVTAKNVFSGFRTGIRLILAAGVTPDIAACSFENCDANVYVQGTCSTSVALRNPRQFMVDSVSVAAGGQLLLPAGSELNVNGYRLNVDYGAALGAVEAAFDINQEIKIVGTAQITDSSIETTTYASWREDPERRHGFFVTDGGNATFLRCEFAATETSGYANDGNPDFWASVIYADTAGDRGANTQVTVQGCSFVSLNTVESYRTGYGVKVVGTSCVIGDSGATRTSFTGFRTGIGQLFGAGVQNISPCTFSDCQWNMRLWGDVIANMTLRNTGMWLVGTSVVQPGVTLTLAAGSELQRTSGPELTVKGAMTAVDCTFRLETRAMWREPERNHGIYFQEGGTGTFDRCTIQTTEVDGYANDGNYTFWAAALHVDANSTITVRGCSFESTNTVNNYRTGHAVRLEGGYAEIGDAPTLGLAQVQTSFAGYRAALDIGLGTAAPVIAPCSYSDTQYSGFLRGDLGGDLVLYDDNYVLREAVNVKSGGSITVAGGGLGTNSRRLTIEAGANLSANGGQLDIYNPIYNYGVLSASGTLCEVRTYAHWADGDRWNGLVLQNGSVTTLTGCSFYTTEERTTGSSGDYAALIVPLAGSALTIDGCFFTNVPPAAGHLTRYIIRSWTGGTLRITNSVFANNYVALQLEAFPGSPLVRNNDFHGNTWAIYNTTTITLPARENWWGSSTGPTHFENPGGTGDRVSDYVDFGQILLEPPVEGVIAENPRAGQEVNNLTLASTQTAVELIACRVLPVNTAMRSIGFRLHSAVGLDWSQFSNFRIAIDRNGDGNITAADLGLVLGTPTARVSGDELKVVYDKPFQSNPTVGRAYILLADITGLELNDAFQVDLDPTALRTTPGVPTASTVSSVRHAVGDWLTLANPTGGQLGDNLNSQIAQSDVPLFGFRLQGPAATVTELTLNLSTVIGINATNLPSVRLYTDANADGKLDAGDPLISSSTSVTIGGNAGTVVFEAPFACPAQYLLVADFIGLNEGDQLTVGLAAAGVETAQALPVIGTADPATHLVEGPYVLSQSNNWEPPKYFGEEVNQQAFPLLGIRITPLGRTINALTVDLSSLVGIGDGDVTNAVLVYDMGSDGTINPEDPVVASGVVAITGASGTIAFDTPFQARGELIVAADFAGLANGNEFTVTMSAAGVEVPEGYNVTGSVPFIRYFVQSAVPDSRSSNQNWTLTYRSPGGLSVNGRYNNAGDKVILGYDTGSAWIYDAQTNTPILMLKDHYDRVLYAGFSTDDSAAITVTRDGAVFIWDVNTGIQRSGLFSDLLVTSAVPSPDFSKLMVITEGKGILLDVNLEQRLWEFIPGQSETVRAIAYSPDGKYVLVGASDKRAYLHDARDGGEIRRYLGHSQAVTAVGFTGDGSYVMTGSTDGTVQLWPTLAGSPVSTISLQGQQAQGAAVSLDGTRIAMITGTGGDALLRMYDATVMPALELFAVNLSSESGSNWGGTLGSLSFDNAGERVIVASRDSDWARVASFRVRDGKYIRSWGPQGRFSGGHASRPRISNDGSRIFYQTDWGLNIVPRTEGKEITRSANLRSDNGYAISADGSKVAWFASASELIVDTVSDGGTTSFLDRTGLDLPRRYDTLSMSPAGDRIGAGDRLYSSLTGSLRANYAGPDGEYYSAFSPDASLWGFADAGDRTLIVMETADRNATLYRAVDTAPYTPHQMLFHPDNRRVGIRTGDVGVQFYDMDSEPEPLPVGLYRFSGNTDAALSNDGTLLLIGGENVVRLYEVRTGRILRYFYPQHSSLDRVGLRAVQFAKDDGLIMIAWSYNYIETYERTRAVALEISPQTRTLARGQSQGFQVEVVYDDNTRSDVSPALGRKDTAILEVDPSTAAVVEGNVVTVAQGASGTFVVRALYRENQTTFTAEATVTVGQSNLVELVPNPAQMALNPGVFRRLRYIARYDDGYETEVTSGVTLVSERPEDVVIAGQDVKINLTAMPGDIAITGSYTDAFGTTQTAETVITVFGLKTVWQRDRLTGGGFGLAGDFSPDGLQLACGFSSGAVCFYDVGVTPSQYALKRILPAHDGPVIFAKYVSNQQMVTVSGEGTVKTWILDGASDDPERVYHHEAPITAAALRDGRLAFGDITGQVGVYNVTTGATEWVVPAHDSTVLAVAIDADTVLTGGEDQRAKLLERLDGSERRSFLNHTDAVIAVNYLTNNTLFLLSRDTTASIIRKDNYQVIQILEYPSVPTAAEVIGGMLYVSTVQPVASWVYNSDGLLLRWLEHPPSRGMVTKHLVDPSGKYLLTGRGSTKIQVEVGGMFAGMGWTEEKVSAFSSFQFFETGRGIFRGSLAHSHSLIDAHVAQDGTIYSQDTKRTIAWEYNVADASATETRLMETGYFVAPSFSGMEFTADDGTLATRVDLSIYRFDTVTRLLKPTLHTPGGGPFALSPDGSRLANSDSRLRLWDMNNLTQIAESNRHCSALDFRLNDKFVGSISADQFVGVWNALGLLESGMIPVYEPINVFVNSTGTRCVVITRKVEGDMFTEIITYFLEVFDIEGVPETEPAPVTPPVFLLTIVKDAFGGGGESPSFSVAVSDDTSLALVGATGNHPVRLINVSDTSTLREFYPPSGESSNNLGSAVVGFTDNDLGVMIGWAEGFVEVYRRSNLAALTLVVEETETLRTLLAATNGKLAGVAVDRVFVAPGQVVRGLTFAIYENGEQLNVTSASKLTTNRGDLLSIAGSVISVAANAPLGEIATVVAEYEELGETQYASVELKIGAPDTPIPTPTQTPAVSQQVIDLFYFSRYWHGASERIDHVKDGKIDSADLMQHIENVQP